MEEVGRVSWGGRTLGRQWKGGPAGLTPLCTIPRPEPALLPRAFQPAAKVSEGVFSQSQPRPPQLSWPTIPLPMTRGILPFWVTGLKRFFTLAAECSRKTDDPPSHPLDLQSPRSPSAPSLPPPLRPQTGASCCCPLGYNRRLWLLPCKVRYLK